MIIFDFDGVLVKSKSLYLKAICLVFRRKGYNTPKNEIAYALGNRIEKLLSMIGVNKGVKRIRKEMNDYVIKRAGSLKPCPFISEVNKIPCIKIVVSNSVKRYMVPFIRRYKLNFREIIGPELSSKEEIFRKLFRKYKIRPSEAYYVGDRAADALIARKVGCRSIIISNKYSWDSRKKILEKNPDAVVSNLKELALLLQQD